MLDSLRTVIERSSFDAEKESNTRREKVFWQKLLRELPHTVYRQGVLC